MMLASRKVTQYYIVLAIYSYTNNYEPKIEMNNLCLKYHSLQYIFDVVLSRHLFVVNNNETYLTMQGEKLDNFISNIHKHIKYPYILYIVMEYLIFKFCHKLAYKNIIIY